MANQGAKKRKEENARHMKTLLRLIIASNVHLNLTSRSVFFFIFSPNFWFLIEVNLVVFFDAGDLCSVEDGIFLLELHVEALGRLDLDFAGLRDPVSAARCYGET